MEAQLQLPVDSLEIEYRPEVMEHTSVLNLRGQATFKNAVELRQALFDAIEGESKEARLVVELAEVKRMDTAALAVLVEGLMATRKEGPSIYFCTPSDSVRSVFELAGLERALSRCMGCLNELENVTDDRT